MTEKIRKYPILVAIIGLVIGWCGIQYIPYGADPISMMLVRVFLSVILVGIMVLMGAGQTLLKFKEDFGYSLLNGLFFLIVSIIIGIVVVIPSIASDGAPEGLLKAEISYFLLSLSVGIFEESLFRGVFLQGILRKTGKTRGGMWCAILVSSLVFGFFHVVGYIIGGSYDLAGIVQTIGKILQTGIIGVLLSVTYLKTRNFWAIAFLHALNDFFPFQTSIFTSKPIVGDYVKGGLEGLIMSVGYALIFVLYLPALFRAIKVSKGIKMPEYGIFKEK